tara:strand:+ start:576 stop:905 length:330 start_codon:yes stop_codon:yes gene_type:complete
MTIDDKLERDMSKMGRIRELYKKAEELLDERDLTQLRMERANSAEPWLNTHVWKKLTTEEKKKLVMSGQIQFPDTMELQERLHYAVQEAKKQWRDDRRSVLEKQGHLVR